MQPSSLVFVAIVALWAAYLLPQWIRRRDALGASRGSDRHSLALRVLQRRARRRRPGRSSAPLLPTAPVTAPPVPRPSAPPAPVALASPTRGGARRRATVLAVLVACTVLTGAAAAAGVVPAVLVLVPAGLLLADVAALRLANRSRSRRPSSVPAPRAAVVRPVRGTQPALRVSVDVVPSSASRARRVPDAVEPVAEALVSHAVDDRSWVPIPVPPPTYTLKPMAPRPEPAPLDVLVPVTASVARTWPGEEPSDVDLDIVLERRRAVND